MKRYTDYRVGLLVGLLTLNTLSACVNTREELAVRNRRHEWGCTAGNMRRKWNGSSACAKATWIGGGVLAGGGCSPCTGMVCLALFCKFINCTWSEYE